MKPANLAPLLVLPFLLAAGQPGELGKPRHGQAESCWALERRSLVQLDAAETVTWLECRQAEEATVEALRRSDVTGAELAGMSRRELEEVISMSAVQAWRLSKLVSPPKEEKEEGKNAEAGRWSSWVKCEEHEGIKSCVARNVCWDVTSRTLRVFDSSDQDVSFTTYLAAKYPPYSTPEEALVVDGSAGECEGCVFLKGVYGLVGRYFAHNRGHVLGDEVWAMFQALSLWGMEEEYRNMQVILHEDALNADVFEFVNARPVWTVGTVINQHGGFLCMETVVFGLAHLGYALGHSCGDGRSVTCRPKFLPPFQVNVRRFRLLAMELHGISERARPEVAQVVVTRKGRKALNPVRLVNTEEVVAAVKSLGVAVLVADWSTMSSKEQLALMSRTDVLVSLPGSDTMNAIWMPWDRSLVTPCRIYMDGRVDEGNETEIWFRYIHNVTRWCGFDRSRDVERVKGESHMRVPVEVVKALVGEQLGRLSDKGYVLPSVPSGGEGRKP